MKLKSNKFIDTPSQTAGPFVHIGCTPNLIGINNIFKSDLGSKTFKNLERKNKINISGSVFDGDKKALLDVMIETWQCNEKGIYSSEEGFGRITSTRGDKIVVFNAIPAFQDSSIIFEGATADAFETTLSVTDPTADRTITFADESGTVISTGSVDAVTEDMMANDAIGQNELKSVVTLQILNSSGTPLKTLYGAGA